EKITYVRNRRRSRLPADALRLARRAPGRVQGRPSSAKAATRSSAATQSFRRFSRRDRPHPPRLPSPAVLPGPAGPYGAALTTTSYRALPRVPEAHERGARRPHRLRRHAGGDDGPGRALRHAARLDRAPVTVDEGTNRLAGTNGAVIADRVAEAL